MHFRPAEEQNDHKVGRGGGCKQQPKLNSSAEKLGGERGGWGLFPGPIPGSGNQSRDRTLAQNPGAVAGAVGCQEEVEHANATACDRSGW